MIYCWKFRYRDIFIYLASSEKGAKKIGISMEDLDPLFYFKKNFSDLKLDLSHNLPLAEAVMNRLMNDKEIKIFLDVTLTPFQWKVLNAIRDIPFGETKTYKQIAEKINRPKAIRAIANALRLNPLPIIFPCHRVVSENSIGGFSFGVSIKQYLLKYEREILHENSSLSYKTRENKRERFML